MNKIFMKTLMTFVWNLLFIHQVSATGITDDSLNKMAVMSQDVLYVCCAVLLIIIAVLLLKLRKTMCEATEDNIKEVREINTIDEEKALCERIEKGFQNRDFKMYLQFIVDNKTKKIASAEALSRWENEDGEILMPGKYIGVMEKYGLIVNFDYYMFDTVCQKLSEWKNTEMERYEISCNITRITISEKDFTDKMKEILDRYDFDRNKLLIEITEDAIEKNLEIAMNNILKLKEMGLKIALDDIGSGYTSLINLCEYPVDVVKIDRNILLKADMERGKKLLLGIIALAHNLNLEVVCEGVETEEQNALVSGSVCDYIQGWYYSKALPEYKAETFAKVYMEAF